jgi:hypothetical protein
MTCASRLFAAVLCVGASGAIAALPADHQRAEEIRAVIGAAINPLGGRPIDRILRTGTDQWRVEGGDCAVDLRVIAVPGPPIPGPRRFRVEAAAAACR